MDYVKLTIDNTRGQYPDYERKILNVTIDKSWYEDCIGNDGKISMNDVLDYADNIE